MTRLDNPKILLVGIPFSSNVGDGVIADCLAAELVRQHPGLDVTHLDMAGRRVSGRQTVRGRSTKLRLLARLPLFLRHAVVRTVLGRMMRNLRPQWQGMVVASDAVLISGGQLFSDSDLNFPIKIEAVASLARESRKPVAVVAAGASRNWSRAGRRMFGALGQCDLQHVGLRDAGSLTAWSAQFPGGPTPFLARDPGLLVRDCYGLPALSSEEVSQLPVGLCITAPLSLQHHANKPVVGLAGTDATMHGFYRDLILALAQGGHRVRLFCNGATEDADLLGAVAHDPALASLHEAGLIVASDTPVTGGDLARIIHGCRGLIAHRLHGCILAYGLGRPMMGLAWDDKLDAFFCSVSCEGWMITDPQISAETITGKVAQMLAEGIDAARHEEVLSECRQGIATAFSAVLK